MQIELGSTYVTSEGEWVKIVSKSCDAHGNFLTYKNSNGESK